MATVTLNGTLIDDGGPPCDCGFEYGPTIAYGTVTPTTSHTSGDTFSFAIIGIAPGIYHYRALATNTVGTSNGLDTTFIITAPIPATVKRNLAYPLGRYQI
jgi:hypothetical protein